MLPPTYSEQLEQSAQALQAATGMTPDQWLATLKAAVIAQSQEARTMCAEFQVEWPDCA